MLLLGPNTHTMRTMRALRCARVCLSLLVHEHSQLQYMFPFLKSQPRLHVSGICLFRIWRVQSCTVPYPSSLGSCRS